MRRYYTGLILLSGETLPKAIKGRGWKIAVAPVLDCKGRSGMELGGKEIVIDAKNIDRARAAFSLILDTWAIVNGVLPERDELF